MKPLGCSAADALFGRVVRDQLAVDVVLAHAPRNELAVLRAEVDDRDGVAIGGSRGRRSAIAAPIQLLATACASAISRYVPTSTSSDVATR